MLKTAVVSSFVLLAALANAAEYVQPPTPLTGGNRSPGVIVSGGKMLYLSGSGAEGANAEEQTRKVFSNLDGTLKQAGGSLANLVQMTIYIKDEKDRAAIQKVRDEMFKPGHYPATVLLMQPGLPQAGYLVYVTGVGVID